MIDISNDFYEEVIDDPRHKLPDGVQRAKYNPKSAIGGTVIGAVFVLHGGSGNAAKMYADKKKAIEALRLGAYDFLEKPLKLSIFLMLM